MKSIISTNEKCYVCETTINLHDHHIFFGVSKRTLSEKYGLKVYLCYEHHEGTNGVHGRNGDKLNRALKKLAQKKFKETYPNLSFIEIFGKEEV